MAAEEPGAAHLIRVPERRARELAPAEWRALQESEEFWRLAEAGYVSCRRRGRGGYEIVGHGHVGRARIGEIELEVHEKVPGTLVALLGAATGIDVRVDAAHSPATEFGLVSRFLMDEFVRAAGSYISQRRRPRHRNANGPVLAGRLDMAATVRLHASGRRGLFAYEQCTVVRDEPLDRLVLAGLDEVDRAAKSLGLDPKTVYDGRWLAGALEEVRDASFLATAPTRFLALGDEIAADHESAAEDGDLARLASVAIMHRGFEPTLPRSGEAPRSLFLSLESLFEQATRGVLRKLLGGSEVDRGEAFERRMFSGGADGSRANPDVVVHHGTMPVAATGDVKYKALEDGKEGRPDIYQVLVHAATLRAPRAFLVYPSDGGYLCRRLGLSATGCATWAVRVRPARLAEDLERFCAEIGLA
jgi:hypothetical protein